MRVDLGLVVFSCVIGDPWNDDHSVVVVQEGFVVAVGFGRRAANGGGGGHVGTGTGIDQSFDCGGVLKNWFMLFNKIIPFLISSPYYSVKFDFCFVLHWEMFWRYTFRNIISCNNNLSSFLNVLLSIKFILLIIKSKFVKASLETKKEIASEILCWRNWYSFYLKKIKLNITYRSCPACRK